MRITKHEHAALIVDDADQALIIDPGSFTTAFDLPNNVVAVVITHEHVDHWTPQHLDRILDNAPGIPIFSTAAVAAAVDGHEVTVVSPGDVREVGSFTLRFFGGDHAEIHSSLPIIDNVGVLVNDRLYYPGDSYAVPEGVDVDTLAAPVGAPWLKIGDAIDFVLAVAPKQCFGTHDMTLSENIGRPMHRQRLQWATEQGGGRFVELDPGQSLEL